MRRDGQSRRPCSKGSTGVEEPGHALRGSSRNLGGPACSVVETEPRTASESEAGVGQRDVGARRSSGEVGEPSRRDPMERRARRDLEP
jgi:hypothetical protein